jgi:hypothetical protein
MAQVAQVCLAADSLFVVLIDIDQRYGQRELKNETYPRCSKGPVVVA